MSSNALQPPVLTPVVDCEPQAFGGPPRLPPVTVLRPRTAAPSGPAQPPRAPGEDSRIPAAAAFADAALRRVLEVIDRRRPLAQLRPLLASGLVDSLLSAAVGGRGGEGAAQLRRVRVQQVRADGTATEVAAIFSRGDQMHAIACRVEQIPTATGPRWQVVALHMG